METPIPKRPLDGRYGVASIILHWLMLILLIGVYAAIELREFFPKGSDPREALKSWHFMLGLSVLALVWMRIAARLIWPAPRGSAESSAWRHWPSMTMHLALYVLMIAMPLAGWMILSAEGKAVPFFGLELPALTADNEGLAERIKDMHELGGTIGYWLIGLHAFASLFHQLVLRDNLLARMVPVRF